MGPSNASSWGRDLSNLSPTQQNGPGYQGQGQEGSLKKAPDIP